ncbi:MAG: hypothetical protein WCP16_01645 [Pseudanabaena sp. ELA645]|jgi:hypothetical protein
MCNQNARIEDIKMDEASIVSALQADLQDYKIKPQIRRKDSQLHVLITRSEGDDLDYATLYDIVKNRIDKLSIEGADNLVMYGRLAGAKQPEWQKSTSIKPPLPLIELDLDELDDFGDIGAIGSFMKDSTDDDTEIQVSKLWSDNTVNVPDSISTFTPANIPVNVSDELDKFEQDLEADLELSAQINVQKRGNDKSSDFELEDLNLDDLDLDAFNADKLPLKDLDLDPIELDSFSAGLSNNSTVNNKTPVNSNDWGDEDDFDLAQTTTVAARNLPLPPPLPPTKRLVRQNEISKSDIPQNDVQKSDIQKTDDPSDVIGNAVGGVDQTSESASENIAKPINKSLLLSVAVIVSAIAVLGTCGWLLWDRSVQQQYLVNARKLDNQNLDPKKILKLDLLAEKRNQLQTTVSQLESIPDRPAALYGDAQTELQGLRPKLGEFDRKVTIEQAANKNLESAKAITLEAAKLTQKAPHKSTIWKSAQEKRQQGVKMLETIPPDSMLYADAQTRLKTYRAGLLQITKVAEIQQIAESMASEIVSPAIVSQLKLLKTKSPDKQKFLTQCKPILQSELSDAESRKVGLQTPTLTDSLCAYYWDS